MMKKKGLIWAGIALIIVCVLMIGVVIWSDYQKNQDAMAGNDTQMSTEDADGSEGTGGQEEKKEPQRIRLMMVGDNLLHMGIVNSGVQADGTRNYDMLFEPIKSHLDYADIKIINQETILGGNDLGFSGYPLFNSPTEVGDAMAKAGFNVVLHSSNHSADRGIKGINNCLDFWANYPNVLVTGIFKEANVPNQDIGLMEVDGVTFAILNYTYSPNMSSLPKSIQGHLGMLCDWDQTTGAINFTKIHPDVLTDIAAAKEMADVVIVCPHWGTEYTFVPTSSQKLFAKQMTEAGADLILGTHAHVIEPVEWVRADNGNKALCYYSLGNYVSTQRESKTMLEAMAWVTFVKEGDSVRIVEEETGAIPLVNHYLNNPVRFGNVYFLDQYTTELANTHGIHAWVKDFSVSNLQKWAKQVLGEWILSSEEVLKPSIPREYWR